LCTATSTATRGQKLTKSREEGARQRRAGVEDIEIGRKIRTLRLERGLSQSRLADGIGLSFQQLQKYESGANRVSAGRLQRIAELLGVPVTVFYGATAVTGTRVKKADAHDEAFAYLQARGAVRLARAYAGISSRATRNALLVLIEALREGS
jgi:transcriptional regulator with XRE-family HTH domain